MCNLPTTYGVKTQGVLQPCLTHLHGPPRKESSWNAEYLPASLSYGIWPDG